MMLRGYGVIKRAIIAACTMLLLTTVVHPAAADSFASLNMFGFPTTGTGLTGLSDITSGADGLSAISSSVSPANQFTGYFGSGLDGIQMGASFAFPTASHDASTIAYSRDVAFESVLGDDSVSFPDINLDMGSPWSDFPTIKSDNAEVK